MKNISIKNARINNLKNIDIDIPINKITCFVGASGSGKSSLAFHTLYNESKRRFINSFPTSMKFFIDTPPPVEVDSIEPVLPVFSLAQINPVIGAREAVIDALKMTEVLQKIFYNFSVEKCPTHKKELELQTLENAIRNNSKSKESIYLFLEKEEYLDSYGEDFLPSYSYSKKLNEFNKDDKYWLLTRFKFSEETLVSKINEFKEKNFNTIYIKTDTSKKILEFSDNRIKKCPDCDYKGLSSHSPHYYSPYNSLGACQSCKGFGHNLEYDLYKMLQDEKSIEEGVKILNFKPLRLGLKKYLTDVKSLGIKTKDRIADHRVKLEKLLINGGKNFEGVDKYTNYLDRKKYKRSVRIFSRTIQSEYLCETCNGSRVKQNINSSFINEISYFDLSTSSINDAIKMLESIKTNDQLLKKSLKKLEGYLVIASNIGLGHLSLQRKIKTLSSSEYQRLLLIKYLSFEGTNSLFIFDEPTLGLDQDEINEIFSAIKKLIEQNNTVILIDHNESVIKSSDYIIGLGPESGPRGGEIIFTGKPKDYISNYLKKLPNDFITQKSTQKLKISKIQLGARNLNDISLVINGINLVYGKSGSGKSTLFEKVLPSEITGIESIEGSFKADFKKYNIENIINIEQSFSNNSRSTFGSVSGLSVVIREHFAKLSISKQLGYLAGHFSSNSELGRCVQCEGRGYKLIEMQYMEDIKITCEYCNGKKLKNQIANISNGNFSVYESFNTPVKKLFEEIKLTPKFKRMLLNIDFLNLSYLTLDREISTLSGGERQRVNLLSKLNKNINDSIIVLKNISFGLSQMDQKKILELLISLCEKGNTVILIDQSTYFQDVIPLSAHIKLKTN